MGRKGKHGASVRYARSKKKRGPVNRHLLEGNTSYTSVSAQKLGNKRALEAPVDHTFGYCILEFSSVFSSISEAVVCKHRNGKITFLQSSERGVGFKLVMKCECDSAKTIN